MAKQTGLRDTTIAALRAIASAVLANPKAYTQNLFVTNFESEQESGCVAFHHLKLTKTARQLKNLVKKHSEWDIDGGYDDDGVMSNPFLIAAQKDLKLTDEQALALLGGVHKWPRKYLDQYNNAKTAKGQARALANRIEFFIASDGTDMTAKELKAAEKERARVEAERLAQRTANTIDDDIEEAHAYSMDDEEEFDDYEDDEELEDILIGADD